MEESLARRCNRSCWRNFGSTATRKWSLPEPLAILNSLLIESSGAAACRLTCTDYLGYKNQRAGCVGGVFLVVDSGIQAFCEDGKFKLFMPVIGPGYLWRGL